MKERRIVRQTDRQKKEFMLNRRYITNLPVKMKEKRLITKMKLSYKKKKMYTIEKKDRNEDRMK